MAALLLGGIPLAHCCRHRQILKGIFALLGFLGSAGGATADTFRATPANYLDLIADLGPGDHLQLQAGRYFGGLKLTATHGKAGKPIVISGPPDRSAVFLGRRGSNTVELRDVSYLEIRNLTLDGRNIPGVDGVKAQDVTHHITLDNLELLNHASHQQTVGISTKAPAWNWVIRGNIIRGAGTGLYLGDSDGSAAFVHGLIEDNVIVDTIGYGLQIKHQAPRARIPGLPTDPGSTIIRRNIISKARQPEAGFQGPRPNLLVGHFPLQGPGAEDFYEIYGNVLYQNLVDEPLFQGEGNIAFYDNLLVNYHGDGIWVQPHNDRPRKVMIFHNTVVAKGLGIAVREGYPEFQQLVAGNAVFAEKDIEAREPTHNLSDTFDSAGVYLRAPFADWADLDLRPRPGQLRLTTAGANLLPLSRFAEAARDFAGRPRDGAYAGAYAGPEGPKEGPLRLLPAL